MKNTAINKWLSDNKLGEGWTPIDGYMQEDHLPVVLLHKENYEFPYSVQYAGCGHYFKSLVEATDYIEGRGWKWAENPDENIRLHKFSDIVSKRMEPISAKELAYRLENCPSYPTNGGWTYDRVPMRLVQDLLDYLWEQAKKEG